MRSSSRAVARTGPTMCKHVAAVLYGIGARLDQQPELLFKLHKVDEKELIAKAGQGLPAGWKSAWRRRRPSAAKTSPRSLGWKWLKPRMPRPRCRFRRRSPSARKNQSARKPKPERAPMKEGPSGACPQGPHPAKPRDAENGAGSARGVLPSASSPFALCRQSKEKRCPLVRL